MRFRDWFYCTLNRLFPDGLERPNVRAEDWERWSPSARRAFIEAERRWPQMCYVNPGTDIKCHVFNSVRADDPSTWYGEWPCACGEQTAISTPIH